MLFAVTEKYKESANCRLELSYAMQEEVDRIPLMLQEGFKAKGWLGLLLGQSVWYAFHDSAIPTDEKFTLQMDALVREIGDRGRIKAEVVSKRTPPGAPAPVPAAPVQTTPSRASLSALDGGGSSPSRAMVHDQQLSSSESLALVERLLDEARADREQAKTERAEWEARLEQQRKEMEDRLDAKDVRIQQQQSEAITQEQLATLQARIEGLHTAKLLADEELFALEDMIADWVEVQASVVGQVVTELALYATAGQPFGVGVKVHKMIKISEVATGDAAFARQLRRKFVQSVA